MDKKIKVKEPTFTQSQIAARLDDLNSGRWHKPSGLYKKKRQFTGKQYLEVRQSLYEVFKDLPTISWKASAEGAGIDFGLFRKVVTAVVIDDAALWQIYSFFVEDSDATTS